MSTGLDGIVRQATELMQQAYNRGVKSERQRTIESLDSTYKRGFDAGYEKCLSENDFTDPSVYMSEDEKYNQGLQDAWYVAFKMVMPIVDDGMTLDEMKEIFGTCPAQEVFRMFTAKSAVKKFQDFERKKAKMTNADMFEEVFGVPIKERIEREALSSNGVEFSIPATWFEKEYKEPKRDGQV